MTFTKHLYLPFAALALCSCSASYKVRSPEQYRQDTRALLESKESSFLSCYETLLTTEADAAGTVVIHFEVQEETGKFARIEALEQSTASEGLSRCVVEGMEGLVLAPPDDKTGEGTMTFEFTQG